MGYPKVTKLLKDEGWKVGTRMVQRLRRELGLAVPAKKPKKRRQDVSTGLPTKATHRGHVWTWDFVHDTTVRGGKLRMLNFIDEFTRGCLCIYVDRRINARKVRRIISELIDIHGAPEHIRSDNGSEFIEKDLHAWLADNQIKTLYIEPGSPWQNGYIESFNARFREECLNREQLWTLSEARVVIEDWRWKYNNRKYNNIRPQRSLGYIRPLEFAQGEIEEKPPTQCWVSGRATPSLRPSIDLIYNLEHIINPSRLTKALAEFGYSISGIADGDQFFMISSGSMAQRRSDVATPKTRSQVSSPFDRLRITDEQCSDFKMERSHLPLINQLLQ
jgi:transposase InsO family protein